MQPPERIGNVKLSSRFPTSSASAMPVTKPETMLIAAKPTKPPVRKPEKPASRNAAFTVCPIGLWSIPGPDTPRVQSHAGSVPPIAGTNQLQKENTIAAPVIDAARKPARDFRGANGRPRIGTREGSGGVRRPHRRPNVEAAVSAQERIITDISATSKGYSESTKTTPRMYHITPLVCFFFAFAHEKAENFFI